jgi:mRNA-decapping enzyme subunit 2
MSCKPVVIRDDVLNDLATRFLINIPDEDKDDPLKLCSHIEVAHWFYLDLIRPEDPALPGCSMKEFMATIFKHCPFLVRDSVARDLDTLQSQWKSLKYRTPTRGAIILNQDLTKCLLVQGYPASTSWGFPKGKLERGESDQDCAIREIYEETGFDIRALIRSEHYLECESRDGERASRMYIIPGVPEETEFKPRVRKEIRVCIRSPAENVVNL